MTGAFTCTCLIFGWSLLISCDVNKVGKNAIQHLLQLTSLQFISFFTGLCHNSPVRTLSLYLERVKCAPVLFWVKRDFMIQLKSCILSKVSCKGLSVMQFIRCGYQFTYFSIHSTQSGIRKINSHWGNFSWNWFIVWLCIMLDSRNFCQKIVRVILLDFQHWCGLNLHVS